MVIGNFLLISVNARLLGGLNSFDLQSQRLRRLSPRHAAVFTAESPAFEAGGMSLASCRVSAGR
jgi:hypothetical protein